MQEKWDKKNGLGPAWGGCVVEGVAHQVEAAQLGRRRVRGWQDFPGNFCRPIDMGSRQTKAKRGKDSEIGKQKKSLAELDGVLPKKKGRVNCEKKRPRPEEKEVLFNTDKEDLRKKKLHSAPRKNVTKGRGAL